MNYMNTPFMASFGGMKEATVKFIISWYHNGKFYVDRPVKISGEVIYKLDWSLKPRRPCPCRHKRRTGRTTNKNTNREELERANDQSNTSSDTTNRGKNHNDRTHPYRLSE